MSAAMPELKIQRNLTGDAHTEGGPFFPTEPDAIEQLGLSSTIIEQIILKLLLARGSASGRGLARELCISMKIVNGALTDIRKEQLVVQKGVSELNDFEYQLTDALMAMIEGGEDRPVTLRKGDTIALQPDVPHSFRVVGDQTLRTLGTHTSPHRIVHYKDGGPTDARGYRVWNG